MQRKKLGVGWNIIVLGDYPKIYVLQKGSIEGPRVFNIEIIITKTLWFMNKSTTTCILKPQGYFLQFSSET